VVEQILLQTDEETRVLLANLKVHHSFASCNMQCKPL